MMPPFKKLTGAALVTLNTYKVKMAAVSMLKQTATADTNCCRYKQ